MLSFLVGARDAFAQQLAQFSQYLHNPIVINPATSGVNENLNLKLSYRNQWTGFTDAPNTYYVSVDGALTRPSKGSSLRTSRPGYTEVKRGKKGINHGVGGYMVGVNYGAFTNNSMFLTYALHMNLTSTIKLSLGVAGGFSSWRLNVEDIGVADPNDETYIYLMTQGLKKSFFDMNSGLWVFSDKFYIGFSSGQLLESQIRDIEIPANARVSIHHFVTGGYRFTINSDLSLTPSLMFKNMRPAPSTVDINVKANYKNQLWGGLSYRTNDALVIIAGYSIRDKINVSYSYDVTLSEINSYSAGSHEIVVGYKVFKAARKSTVSFL